MEYKETPTDILLQDMTKIDQHRLLMDHLLAGYGENDKQDSKLELHVLGNLPFNVSTVLLTGWLRDLHEQRGLFHSDARRYFSRQRLTLMFQKEVGDRILAKEGSAERSRLSVLAQTVCQVRQIYNVPRTTFTPRPKVDAIVVQFEPHENRLYSGKLHGCCIKCTVVCKCNITAQATGRHWRAFCATGSTVQGKN